jgi:hypothetical protein
MRITGGGQGLCRELMVLGFDFLQAQDIRGNVIKQPQNLI